MDWCDLVRKWRNEQRWDSNLLHLALLHIFLRTSGSVSWRTLWPSKLCELASARLWIPPILRVHEICVDSTITIDMGQSLSKSVRSWKRSLLFWIGPGLHLLLLGWLLPSRWLLCHYPSELYNLPDLQDNLRLLFYQKPNQPRARVKQNEMKCLNSSSQNEYKQH